MDQNVFQNIYNVEYYVVLGRDESLNNYDRRVMFGDCLENMDREIAVGEGYRLIQVYGTISLQVIIGLTGY